MKALSKTMSSPPLAEPGDRGADGQTLARALEHIELLAHQNAKDADAVVAAAQADDARDAAERAEVEQIERDARALEMENRARLARLLLRQSACGVGAFAVTKLLLRQTASGRGDRGRAGRKAGRR